MNEFKNYYYLYKDSMGLWGTAGNPVFIAKHGYCRALPKQELVKAGYDLVCDFVYMLNNTENKSQKVTDLIKDWDLS